MLNDDKIDVLREYINVFIGKAASLLSEMVDRKIKLTVPRIQVVENYKANNEFVLGVTSNIKGHVMSTAIDFDNYFTGSAKLIFPTEKIKKLISICMGDEEEIIEDEFQEFVDTDFDVMREIGNVILNSVIGGLSNLLKLKLVYSVPNITIHKNAVELVEKEIEDYEVLLMIHMLFEVENTDITGIIINMLSMESIKYLEDKITLIWDEMNE